ncbi:hypothetical protein GXW74_15660 [Roseomonas eburnea]|uniref:Uncharacterized protein n=1 Tax=Neoroseomonas eburnea TaxID=1346889 RepID=A0A9X9XDZ5_9PROT|nr:hypothetical protein [Neoroseomonas eburnea]MBR0681931.1 hypothetical protein [Neoroseomonas eburnea]
MIAKALSALAGPLLPYAAGAVVALLLVLGGAWQVQTWRLDAAQARVTALTADLAEARDAMRARDTVIGALQRQADAVAAAAARLEPIRRDVNAAPRTSACLASPAVARGLERLRASRPAAAGAQPRAVAPDVSGGAGRS